MQLKKALDNVHKCFVAPDKIDPNKLNDYLAFNISLTVIEQAVSNKQITDEQVLKIIKGEISSDIILS